MKKRPRPPQQGALPEAVSTIGQMVNGLSGHKEKTTVAIQMLATPLYAVPEVRTDIGPMTVLGFNEKGDPFCLQLGILNGVTPIKPAVWDQRKLGRLSFYTSLPDAEIGSSTAQRRLTKRTEQLMTDVDAFVSESVR